MDGTRRKDDLADEPSTVPLDPDTLAERAVAALPPGPRAYLVGGAETEGTIEENRRAFDRVRIRPRALRDTSARDHGVTVGDERLAHPLVLAPIGMQTLYDEEGEVATARAAGRTDTPLCLSTVSSASLEAVAAAHDEGMGDEPATRWFQVYWSGRALTTSLVRRAEAAGYTALVLTVDTPVTGWRTRELESGFGPFDHGHGLGNYTTDPVVRDELGADPDDEAVRSLVDTRLGDASLEWADVAWLREQTDLPLYLKGIMCPDDARRAAEVADGLVVSNHGGRQVDGELAALDALGPIVRAVDERVPILFDSGIRTGADVFRALAVGADAVLLGRPYCYGLALAGERGVVDVVRNLRAAFDLTLELGGYAAADEVDEAAIVRVDS